MILYQEKYADLQNVSASALSPMKIPCRNNHHGLILNFISAVPAALTQAQIETDVESVSIHIKPTGRKPLKILDQITPAEIFDLLNDYPEAALSTYTNAGAMYIPFTRPGRFRAQNWSLSLGMLDVEDFQLQVKFTAGLTTAAVVEVIPVVDLLPMRPLGEHIELRVDTRDLASTGVETIHNPPIGEPGTALVTTHIGLGSAPGVISNVEAVCDGRTVYSNLSAAINNLNLHRRRFTPNADYFHVPFDLDFEPIDVGNAKSLIQRFTWSTAPVSYRLIYEMVCGLELANK